MNKNHRLSLCMIVKDEEACIEASLKSACRLVDEMIVVDTGSQDNTPVLARSLGARIFYFPWQYDFAAARNASLSHATGEWILVLDADEVIDEEDHPRILALIENGHGDAFRLIQRSYQKVSSLAEWELLEVDTPLSKGCRGFLPSPLVRLFRNIPGIRFRGRVHELIEHDLIEQGRTIIDTDIPIHHYGKINGNERLLRKQALYLQIGEDKILEQPSDARAFRDLGIQYIELGMYPQAESALEKALALDSGDTKIPFNLALAKAALDKSEEAIRIYKRIMDADPAHIGAINNLAMLLQKKGGERSQIEAFYKKALITNPSHHVLHFNYGLFLEKYGDINSAVEEYTRALKIEPHFEQAQQRLDRISVDRSINNVSAKDHSRKLITSGERHLREGKWVDALEAFVSALEKDSLNPDLRYQCGYALEMLGRIEEALEQYEEAMAIDPGHSDTLFRLALEADRQGLDDDCITLYEKLLSINPGHRAALFNLACALEKRGRLSPALECLESLLHISPDHMEALAKVKTIRGMLNNPVSTKPKKRRLKIAFLWGGNPFAGDTLDKKPLGGTETAMIHMARQLSLLGHDVTVFVNKGNGIFDNVRYADLSGYHQELEGSEVDILIAARYYHPFTIPVDAKVRIFWTEDAHDQPFVEPLCRPEILVGIDRIFTVSRWQTGMLSSQFNIPGKNFYITRNGVMWEYFKEIPIWRNHKKLIYTSTPFRGLDVLLDVFPEIKKQVPDAELDIYSSMAVYQVNSDEDEAMYGDLYRKAEQPGVHLKKSVLQSDLARALLSAGLFAYPNHFPETSCIAAMEAMAAGLPIVTSHLGALPETVASGGILIQKDSRQQTYQRRFVDEVCALMDDPVLWKAMSDAGRDWIYRHNRWDLIAGEWAEEFERLLHHRQHRVNEPSRPGKSQEQMMVEEDLSRNRESVDPFFGKFFSCLRSTLSDGGSEFGLGISLFALAVSIRAKNIIEIGCFKGFSTVALASALKFLEMGWDEPLHHKQRPGINYAQLEYRSKGRLYSIDPAPTNEAESLIRDAGLEEYVEFINQRSCSVRVDGIVDLIFIDGDHSYKGCIKDVELFIPRNLRPGGYFVLHDYFGWFDDQGRNGSPIKRVVDEIVSQGKYQSILYDTGYQSFVVFRKPDPGIGL